MKKVWTEEREAWLWKHRTEGKQELYELFIKEFPDVQTTPNGIVTHRSEIGASIHRPNNRGGKPQRPLYSEQIKKGYVKIKIAQPNVWEYKSKWVWMETHPDLYDTIKDTDIFVFLDGNNRNFSPDNIYKTTRGELGIVNQDGGIVKDAPELNLLKFNRAKLIMATLDAGEKIGLVVKDNAGRQFREIRNEKARKYHAERYRDPKYREKIKQWAKNTKERRTPEQIENQKRRQHEWYIKHKQLNK